MARRSLLADVQKKYATFLNSAHSGERGKYREFNGVFGHSEVLTIYFFLGQTNDAQRLKDTPAYLYVNCAFFKREPSIAYWIFSNMTWSSLVMSGVGMWLLFNQVGVSFLAGLTMLLG